MVALNSDSVQDTMWDREEPSEEVTGLWWTLTPATRHRRDITGKTGSNLISSNHQKQHEELRKDQS